MKDKKILIDTSVWINYFKGADAQLNDVVDDILTEAGIVIPKVGMAELLQGAKTEKEISVIEEFMGAFHVIDQTEDTWLKAGKLAFQMKRKGTNVHLTDCYIAVLATEYDCMILYLDEHFSTIKKFLRIELYE